jgi:hypothetical protein
MLPQPAFIKSVQAGLGSGAAAVAAEDALLLRFLAVNLLLHARLLSAIAQNVYQ